MMQQKEALYTKLNEIKEQIALRYDQNARDKHRLSDRGAFYDWYKEVVRKSEEFISNRINFVVCRWLKFVK